MKKHKCIFQNHHESLHLPTLTGSEIFTSSIIQGRNWITEMRTLLWSFLGEPHLHRCMRIWYGLLNVATLRMSAGIRRKVWPTVLKTAVQFSRSVVSDSLQPHDPQHAKPPCPSPTPGVYSNPCPSSPWCHITISSFVVASSCLQSFPTIGSLQMSQLFTSGSQNTGVSASTSALPMNTQDWFPLGWTGWISLQSKGLSRVFSNTTVQKHQFFGTQLSLSSNSHIHTWLLEKT